MTRHRNDGLRKLCGCPRRTWAKCSHPWHFAFKWNGEHYRFSLERQVRKIVNISGKWHRDRATLGDPITNKTDAEKERDRLRSAIREGALQGRAVEQSQQAILTLAALAAAYQRQYVAVYRTRHAKSVGYMLGVILRTPLERLDGTVRPLGEWLVCDVTTDAIERYRGARRTAGATGTNRHLEVLRHVFGWATSSKRKLATDNPFLDGSKPAVKLAPEYARKRRLRVGEGAALLAACTPHLWAVVQAAIETGMRRGEILSLQWEQVRFTPRAEIYLPAAKTKTKSDRTIPMSSTVKAILEMRRLLANGRPFPPTAYVFGNEAGERVNDIKRAWQTAVLKAHGHTPAWAKKTIAVKGKEPRTVRTGELADESRERYHAIDLHFHDLRREAGSRWLDAGVPLHRIQKWLGHTNISQTSTYLDADSAQDDDAMKRFEEQQARLQQIATDSETGGQTEAQLGVTRDSGARISSTSLH